jgi:N-acetylglucosaminyl-diphospho-decaprenol L-rhamnosyltransferase
MDLSIIILNWNSLAYLMDCLSSITVNVSDSINKEIILIDNGSNDGSIGYIKKNYPDILLIENSYNKGVAPARNQGLSIAKGKYLLLLDVDTIVYKNAIEKLMETMERDKRIGLCGPKLIRVDGTMEYSCREFLTIMSKIYRQLPAKLQDILLTKEELRDWPHDSLREVGYVIGACQLIRKTALEDIGLLDSRMFYGVEEVDFCLRLWRKGWKVVYNPESVVMHVWQGLSRRKLFTRIQLEHFKSLLLFFYKEKYMFKAPSIEQLKHRHLLNYHKIELNRQKLPRI